MQLLETNWDAPGGAAAVPVDYPDAPIQEFVNWIRRTSAWVENPDIVERKVRKLNAVLLEHRNGTAQAEETASQKQRRLAAEQAAIAEQIARSDAAAAEAALEDELEKATRPDVPEPVVPVLVPEDDGVV